MATSEEYEKMSASEKKKEDWMNAKWRPMMGWSYMATCITDFVIFPILWSVAQIIGGGEVKMQWQPITLMGAGLYHVAMGAVLGLAAWGRTQEKLNGANNGGIQTASMGSTPTFSQPQTGGFVTPTSFNSSNASGGFTRVSAGGFGGNSGSSFSAAPVAVAGFGAAAAASVPFMTNEVVLGPNGKPAPVQPEQPEI